MNTFQKRILTYYKEKGRDLPWRHTTNPYKVLVSEVMLQQTQVDRVIDYYHRFLKKYPDVHALAKARKLTLLKLWSGLGYNNRVLRLQKLAQVVVKEHNGIIPQDEETLLSLPGIGPYTAHAIMAFAFNIAVPVIDTNIRRIYIHELKLKEDISMDELKDIALKNVPKGRSRDWHNALMDYGAIILTARKTGIKPLTKQSTFKGSDRQIRGQIVKRLLTTKKLSITALEKEFNKVQVQKVVEKMVKETIIKVTKKEISLT